MLEDCTMEKKSSGRTNQPPAKGNATESKKYPDSNGNKIFPRTSRRREPFNPQGTKYETSRKPVPQKNKSLDKRPNPRGQYNVCGKEGTQITEYEDQNDYPVNSSQGSKKVNLSHLLNFRYAPRERSSSGYQSRQTSSGKWGRNTCKWLMTTHKHKYNKEQFLQANCQFVVKSAGNYSSYMENPDLLVDWNCIEQIRLRGPELSCPICLYPPVAAKMTRCGHVFCWACILHYLALSDKTWRKCPICYEAVHKKDLRSVEAVPHATFSVGEEITMRLMKRKRGSLLAFPMDQSDMYSTDKLLSVSETGIDTKYSKLLLASSQEVALIIEKEKCALTVQLSDSVGCPEACFVEQALILLKERAIANGVDFELCDSVGTSSVGAEVACGNNLDTGSDMLDNEYIPSEEVVDAGSGEFYDTSVSEMYDCNESGFNKCGDRVRYESMSSEGMGSEDGAMGMEDVEGLSVDPSDEMSGKPPPKDFYFYQAEDGQHVYLHAVNVRMLEHLYGSLKNCPLTLTGQIVEKESGSMTEELRQRLRYLQHLPVTCQFEVAEVLLKPPVINKETIHHFRDQLELRKQRRMRRARDERRREKRITEEEKRRWGRFPSPNISLNSHQQFPSCGVDIENSGINNSETASSAGSNSILEETYSLSAAMENLSCNERSLEDITATTSSSDNAKLHGSPAGPSFAQMLREGKGKAACEWPSVSRGKPKEKMGSGRRPSVSDESDGEQNIPKYRVSFSDCIAEAMLKASVSTAKDDLREISGSKGKKKKQKQKVLFATGLACESMFLSQPVHK